MKRVLGRKQSMDNARWLEAMTNIEELVTLDELNEAVATAIEDIKTHTKGKKSAYAWSGGKDSLVIEDLCKKIGITDCVFAHTNLEYPAFLEWCLEHKPEGCEVINTGQDLDWLAKHPAMLFPDNSTTVSRWFGIVQRNAIRKYFLSHAGGTVFNCSVWYFPSVPIFNRMVLISEASTFTSQPGPRVSRQEMAML